MEQQRRRRSRSNPQVMYLILLSLFLFLTVSLIVKGCSGTGEEQAPIIAVPDIPNISIQDTQPSEPVDTNEPYIVSTASIGVTGDVMGHGPVLNSVLDENGQYNFSECFQYIAPYFSSYDFMVANLEVTLGGTEAGEYRGYPTFNCPDSVIDALKAAGVDMVTTATNHSYDTGHNGFIRTQEVLSQKGMLYTGTRTGEDQATYTIQNINGIRVGMINYTYEQEGSTGPRKNLNGIQMESQDNNSINSFNYKRMDAFYAEAEAAINAMRGEGADFVMFFIHWGNEYALTASNTQKKIAQTLCDKGVDVIVGGHPHVVQPMQVLTNESGHQTFCIYSVGNSVSNQRRYEISSSPNGHTEDGVIFNVQFSRWSDGSLRISNLNVTPLWVSLDETDGDKDYTVLPVDISYKSVPAISKFAYAINSVIDPANACDIVEAYVPGTTGEISASYNRTMQTILASLNDCRKALGLDPVVNAPGK